MRILGIDSSCSSASCAILCDNKLEAEIFLNHKLMHSIVLFPMIERVLDMVELSIDDIDGVAVSGGPGSFTGIRIGVSAAKGIAQGGNKKFSAISSLDAMAFQQFGFEGVICPILDALRDNVYTALYSFEKGLLNKIQDYSALHIEELLIQLEKIDKKIIFCGDAALLHKNNIIEKLKAKACFSPLSQSMPRASSIAELAAYRFEKGLEDDLYTYSPIYLRKPQAVREYEKKHGEAIE
jgi:tRNA threonylcarbamoyladenosine biosynthesis protein TsaB